MSQFLPTSAGITAVIIAALLFTIFIPKLQVLRLKKVNMDETTRFELENQARLAVAKFITGIAILTGIFFTWRDLGNTQEQLRMTESGQITERFTRAIEQFGSDNITIRLGGIYSLERIAKDSKYDYWNIMEILTTYARDKNPVVKQGSIFVFRETVPKDLQALMTVIGRRRWFSQESPHRRIDLHETDLQRLKMQNANFLYVNLEKSNLGWVHLEYARLEGANLHGANLYGAHLDGSDLNDANFLVASLRMADLTDTQLQGANLTRADLRDAKLQGANLTRANLRDAKLQGVNLEKTKGLTRKQLETADIDEDTKLPGYLK